MEILEYMMNTSTVDVKAPHVSDEFLRKYFLFRTLLDCCSGNCKHLPVKIFLKIRLAKKGHYKTSQNNHILEEP